MLYTIFLYSKNNSLFLHKKITKQKNHNTSLFLGQIFLSFEQFFWVFAGYTDDIANDCSNFWPTIPVGAVMLGMDRMMFTSPVFWLGLFLIPFTALIVDITFKV